MKINLTNLAIEDLSAAKIYIEQNNPLATKRMIRHIFESIDYLMEYPSMGKMGRAPNTRELVISGTPFIVIYQIRRLNIFILRILHGARKWPDKSIKRK